MSPYSLSLIGGDLRIAWLAQLLSDDGHIVKIHAMEEVDFPFDNSIIHCSDAETTLDGCDACILGIPSSKDRQTVYAPFSHKTVHITDILSHLSEGQYLFGGMLPIRHARVVDYAQDESFVWANTLPTAEGALQLLMQNMPSVVAGSKIAIIGYGRVAQTTAMLLKAVGAYITIFARDPIALAKATAVGINAEELSQFKTEILKYHAVLNTVPTTIIASDVLANARKDVLLIELASSPGGFDLDAIQKLQLRYILAGGLPGKVAPKTAAKYMKNAIMRRLEEFV